MTTFVSRFPLVDMGSNDFLALDVGAPAADVGEKVNLVDLNTRVERADLTIQAIDKFAANDLPEGFLEIVGFKTHANFFRMLQAYMGTGLPEDVQIIAYLIGDEVVSAGGLFEDEAAAVAEPVTEEPKEPSKGKKG